MSDPKIPLPGPRPGMASAALNAGAARAARRHALGFDEQDDELEMTPMIDMTFLLLIFFMVTSSVTPMANLQLPHSKTGRAEEAEKRVVLLVDFPRTLSKDELKPLDGSRFLTLADAKMAFADEPGRTIPAAAIDAELQKKLKANPGSRFLLQANRKMPVGVVRKLIKSAAEAGALETLVGVTMPR